MSAVAGVGTDLLRAGTIALSVAAPSGPFVQKAHSAAERAHIQSRVRRLYS